MYIHKKYSISKDNQDIKVYKELLKGISKINLRRTSKLNILGVLGALTCVEDKRLSQKVGIYVSSEYSSISSVKTVIEKVSQQDIIMPFDFLNINSNNLSFYISQALNATSKNMLLSSQDLGFEKALEMAFFDLEIDEIEDALIGSVDETITNIKNYNSYISNVQNLIPKDTSSWIYINKEEKDSLAKIEKIEYFEDIKELNKELENSIYKKVSLNQFATKYQKDLHIKENLIYKAKQQNIHSANTIIELLEEKDSALIHISLDKNTKAYLIKFTR